MTSTDDIKALKSENRKLNKALKGLSESISLYLGDLEKPYDGRLSGAALGSEVAKLGNKLDMTNDQISYFTLGVDYRKDDKGREYRRLVKKHRGKSCQS